MPIYEFKCSNCENVFEELIMSVGKESEVACPKCGSKDVAKLISQTGSFARSRTSAGSCSPNAGSGFS